jgi:hypothetical protein
MDIRMAVRRRKLIEGREGRREVMLGSLQLKWED